jgi:conjugative relaxase-like TrwC/TraI family protein
MMTIKALDSVKQARSYYSAEKGIASYYSSEASAYGGGQWYGRGADALGLRGPIHEKQWNRALEGKFGKGKDSFQVGIADPAKRRPGVDLQFAPPKSVSIMALAVGDDRLIGAHDRAVERTMARIEAQQVFARMKHGGSEKVLTGNLCAALYPHVTDRPVNGVVDCQLHTHAVVLNVTQRPDGQWVSINFGMDEGWIKGAGAIYRMELAKEIRALGYELYETKDGFEIKGVSREIIEMFSARSGQIVDELARQGKTRATATTAEKQTANLATRRGKEKQDGAELRAEWRARAEAVGLVRPSLDQERVSVTRPGPTSTPGAAQAQASYVYEEALARGPVTPTDPVTAKAIATDGVQAAVRHLAERESAFSQSKLIDAVQAFLPAGLVDGHDLEQAITRESEACRLLPATEGRYTTAEAIMREREFIARIKDGLGAVQPIITNAPPVMVTADGKTLNIGQRNACAHILESPDRFTVVQGVAGAGKTTAMKAVREQAEAAGFQVVGMAPMHKSAQELRDAGITNTYTIARACASMPKEIDDKTLIIVDECSMVGAATMADLTEKIAKTGARSVSLGDFRQMEAIEAGAPHRQMQDHVATAVLDEIVRQKNADLKACVEAFAAGRPAEGAELAKPFMREVDLSSLKDVRFDNPHQKRVAEESLIAGAAARYLTDLPREDRDNHMVITGTNVVRREINAGVREDLQERGELSTAEVKIEATEKLDFTEEQIRHASSYEVGQVVEFRRDYQSHGVTDPVDRTHQYEITAIDPDHNKISLVDREDGQKIEWSPQIAQKATISKKFELTVSEGDRVYFRAHDPDRGIVNGDRGTVRQIEDGRIEVATDRGEIVDLRRGDHVDHAYCVTTNSAQSATTGTPIMGHHSDSPTASARQGYVGLSRGTDNAVIFTNSKDDLAKSWSTAKQKETAYEVRLDGYDLDSVPKPDHATERAREDENAGWKPRTEPEHAHETPSPDLGRSR